MKATTVHQEIPLFQECKRLYLIDAHTDPEAATRYLAAIEDVDSALLYIDSHPNSWTASDAARNKQVCEVLDRLTAEGEEFNRSQKERDAKH
jgi:hypothetical protein